MDDLIIPHSGCSEYLYRFNKDELVELMTFMRLSSGPKPLKQDLIMKIKEQYPNGFSLDQLAIMDILYTINRMYKTKWTVYQLDGRTSKDPNSVNPRVISRRISDELQSLINCHVFSMIRDGILWTRILLVEPVMGQLEFIPSATNDTSTTFIVHVLGSNYFLTSLLPDSYRSCVLTTFCSSIRQSKYTQLALTGGDVRSLLNLVMNTDSGGFADYLNQLKENRPLDRGAIRETTPTLCQQLPKNVHFVDEKNVMANHIRSESEWGIAEPPAIQQVVVNSVVDSTLEGTVVPRIHMSVELQGPNVLQGLKELTEFGYATKIPVQISFENARREA
ncbi:hypothetical protein WA538_004891 [Blastocystis sp. DL]